MDRSHACKYDDTHQKSRTQQLKEQLASLEKRLQELDSKSSQRTSSSPFSFVSFDSDPDILHLEHFDSCQWSFANPYSLGDYTDSSSRPSSSSSISSLSSSSSSSIAEPLVCLDPRSSLPSGEKQYLLSVFMQHRHQCWFYASMDRFIESSRHPCDREPHPALLNAIYLLACHFAQSPNYSAIEPDLLVQAQWEINSALDRSDRLTDVIQASCLLAIYLYLNNRATEGYRHVFTAARLAVDIGLHQIHRLDLVPEISHTYDPVVSLPPPFDDTELSDRILAFWQVFMVDRCWSVASGLPLALLDKDDDRCRILTPWPSSLSSTKLERTPAGSPLDLLLGGPVLVGPEELYIPALKAKAAALLELTARSITYLDEWSYPLLEAALHRFSAAIPSIPDRDYIVVQTIIYSSFINLRKPNHSERAFDAAQSIVTLIRQLGDADYQYLDPIISVLWFSAADMLCQALGNPGYMASLHGGIAANINSCNVFLDILHDSLKKMAIFCPSAGSLATKVELSRVPSHVVF